ncbi:hypothetical protein CTRI78_v006795 [Colletotrichum trifolii]|uniref:Protein kinase domain-containing protein n=1 Tax=Colletotrichum trifolii TaxID=5466 RepID=A0A4R8RBI8_COLTR|nr:hypothetical protein CTRI78_v006795 [Colletotrichum trifolii]
MSSKVAKSTSEASSDVSWCENDSDVAVDLVTELERYDPFTEFLLAPHDPPEPYGLRSLASDGPRAEDIANANAPPLFRPRKELDVERFARIEVIKPISTGIQKGAQILLCKSIQQPTFLRTDSHAAFPVYPDGRPSLLVAKVFDPLFYSDDRVSLSGPYGGVTAADEALSRETAVYDDLFKNKLTGYPHLAPEYYGCWATHIEVSDTGESRFVGLILMEYINGLSIHDLCTSEGPIPTPRRGPVLLDRDTRPLDRPLLKKLDLEVETRQRIVAILLDKVVSQIRVGIDHEEVNPRNVLVSFRNNGKYLSAEAERPRVVMVDYNMSTVYNKTTSWSPKGKRSEWVNDKPPHPWIHFDAENMAMFEGWLPEPLWRRGGLDRWMVHAFGAFDGSDADSKYCSYEEAFRKPWKVRQILPPRIEE